ncbi:MAG: ferredoxin:thioredoxin reductase [Candidatus Wallbacteria bacterium]|nr:ferredoxin:thioredoxin reductase [Candidatus Wallbacteria bacterium]
MNEPSQKSLERMQTYVRKYCEKTGTATHPNKEVTESVVKGLASHLDVLGKPLCPCNFYPDKKVEITSRRWFCACDEMKRWKYCHCLLFVREDGLPVTEYLPADHEGRQIYGEVKDPTPDKGRESRALPPSPPPKGETL